MKKCALALALLAGIVAGCAFSQPDVHAPLASTHSGSLVVETAPATTSAPAKRLPEAFTQQLFHFEGRGRPSPSPLTAAWIERPARFEVQHPFDLKLQDRWSYDPATDTQDVWVLGTDKPHLPPPNRTTPRTELRLIDADYLPNSGLHMMSCDLYIVKGTFATITQVFARGPMAMIVVDPEGTITDLRSHAVIARNMNDKWFNWKVLHDSGTAGRGAIKIYVDNRLAAADISANRSASYYFKVGVYSRHGSIRSEVKIRDLRVFQKPTPNSGPPGASN